MDEPSAAPPCLEEFVYDFAFGSGSDSVYGRLLPQVAAKCLGGGFGVAAGCGGLQLGVVGLFSMGRRLPQVAAGCSGWLSRKFSSSGSQVVSIKLGGGHFGIAPRGRCLKFRIAA